MITDKDIEKMKKVFATKGELRSLKVKMATKEDLKKYATKEDIQRSTDELVDLITVSFGRVDKAIERMEEHDDIINNHEHRLDKLEDNVYG